MLKDKKILLIITGGISAYKALELIRLLNKQQAVVRCILTRSGAEFVTPLSVAALSEHAVYDDLFSLKDESEMGHIRLSREADLILIAPATANIMAKMAHGIADDLATTTLLATNRPVMIAPAMNPMMWSNIATQDNVKTLKQRGFHFIDPATGEMACGETGQGRLAEPEDMLKNVIQFFDTAENKKDLPLKGKTALITSGPTYEPIDPVRFIGNHSSGKQGIALAVALRDAGADVTLVTGPTKEQIPNNINVIHIQSACEMLKECEDNIPNDIAICAAAVADWTPVSTSTEKIKKSDGAPPPSIQLTENPDILKTISTHEQRPKLVIGFAAETSDIINNAVQKHRRKKCNWILANDVSLDKKTFGNDYNTVHLIKNADNIEKWSNILKTDIATKLTNEIIDYFA